jgi:hypothetical protein
VIFMIHCACDFGSRPVRLIGNAAVPI